MIYSDGLGKCFNIDVEVFLSMSDEDFQDLRSSGYGEQIPEDPFHDTYTKPYKIIIEDDEIDDIIREELNKIDNDLDLDLDLLEE